MVHLNIEIISIIQEFPSTTYSNEEIIDFVYMFYFVKLVTDGLSTLTSSSVIHNLYKNRVFIHPELHF